MAETAALPIDVEATLETLLALPPDCRIILGERLVASVPIESSREQRSEWERRVSELDANPAVAVDLEDSMQRLKVKLDARRQTPPGG